jgi:hypothetical protein
VVGYGPFGFVKFWWVWFGFGRSGTFSLVGLGRVMVWRGLAGALRYGEVRLGRLGRGLAGQVRCGKLSYAEVR